MPTRVKLDRVIFPSLILVQCGNSDTQLENGGARQNPALANTQALTKRNTQPKSDEKKSWFSARQPANAEEFLSVRRERKKLDATSPRVISISFGSVVEGQES